MKLYIISAIIIAFIFAFPYLKAGIRRIRLYIKLMVLCARNNARLYLVNPLSIFAFNHGKCSDMYIETQYEILSIKLFGITGHLAHLVFHGDRKYTVKKSLPLFGRWGTTLNLSFQSKETLLPVYKFDRKFKKEWDFKTLRKILLLNPTPLEIESTMMGNDKFLGNGSYVYDMELFSYNGLKRIINNEK